jgi:hypothetical protein
MRCSEYNSTPVSICGCPVPSVTSSLLANPHVLAPAGSQPRNPSPLIRSLSSTKAARCLQVYSPRVSSLTLLDNPSVAPLLPLTASSLTCFSRHVFTLSPQSHSQQRKLFLFLSSYTVTSIGLTLSQNSTTLSLELDQPAFSCCWYVTSPHSSRRVLKPVTGISTLWRRVS